ncbi:hypothetical protein LTR66_015083, partial [Elasticomyces elasticus]
MSTAQDEFDELFREKANLSHHPEDASLSQSSDDEAEPGSPGTDAFNSSEEDAPRPAARRSNYFVPSLRSEANTGPKGVIADAQAFQEARRSKLISFSTLRHATHIETRGSEAFSHMTLDGVPEQAGGGEDEDDEKIGGNRDDDDDSEVDDGFDFLKQWRRDRLRQMRVVTVREKSQSRSRGRRLYGSLVAVDGEGYLDAIEQVAAETVVV